jgi:hypothetical protein
MNCVVGWVDGDRVVKAMYLECENPLIGVEMLDGCHLDITFEPGGSVEID